MERILPCASMKLFSFAIKTIKIDMLFFALAYQNHIYTQTVRSWDVIDAGRVQLETPWVICQLFRNKNYDSSIRAWPLFRDWLFIAHRAGKLIEDLCEKMRVGFEQFLRTVVQLCMILCDLCHNDLCMSILTSYSNVWAIGFQQDMQWSIETTSKVAHWPM